jgi:hypothetical protein
MLWVHDLASTAPVGHYPVHNYNFDLASLNFAFRHLTNPVGQFEIGVHMPRFDMLHLGRFEYVGKAKIQYQAEESCHDVTCRKYTLSGEAFADEIGYLWVNKERGYFEKVEVPVRDNPGWKDFKLELTGVDRMSEEKWSAFVQRRTEEFFADGN